MRPCRERGGYVRSMRLHRSPYRRVPTGEHGYNEANGPAGPYCFGPCPVGEWDDPTWVTVTVDEEYMVAETDQAIARKYVGISLEYPARGDRARARIMRLLDEDEDWRP